MTEGKFNLLLSDIENASWVALKLPAEGVETMTQMLPNFERGLVTLESKFPDVQVKRMESGTTFQQNSNTPDGI
jgi:hypothetical protein